MKTTLNELIDKWKMEIGSYIPNIDIYKKFIEEAESFLEQEKHQLKSAYAMGVDDADGPWVDDQCREEWFNSFYNNKDNEE